MSRGEALWIGVDVGTQSVKAAVIDGDGVRRASATSPLDSRREARPDGGRHEQSPAQWVDAARSALTEAMKKVDPSERSHVAGIAVCATSGSLAVVDAGGHPIADRHSASAGHPVDAGLMYDDARAGALADEVRDAAPDLWARLGYRIQPTWALPKILWLQRNGYLADEGVFVAHQADVVASSFIGRRSATDWSHALKSGYDLLDEAWPLDALLRLGIDPGSLPEVVAPGTLLGHTDALLAAHTGIPEATPVFAGMTDGCAAQLGAAAVGLGDWHTVVGTTMVMKTVSAALISDDAGAVYSHRSPEPGLWLPGGASNVGAGILSELFPGVDLDTLTAAVAERYDAGPATDLPFSYPLPGQGERFPIVAPTVYGFASSGGVDHPFADAIEKLGRIPVYAAVLVGVACVERLALEQLTHSGAAATGTLSSSGGGTRNAWWVQLRADLLGREITVSTTADGSTGMAILAAWAAEQTAAAPDAPRTLEQVAVAMSHSDTVYRPDAARSAELDDLYARFIGRLTEKGWLTP